MVNTPDSDLLGSSLTLDAQYRLLVEAVTDYAIYMLDPDGLVMSWNPGAERFKGYRAPDILGKSFSLFYTAEDQARGEPRKALDTAARDGRFESEGWRIRQDGSRFWASVIVAPIRFADGVLLGFAKVTRDITQQKEALRALDQAQAALVQSQKMDAIGRTHRRHRARFRRSVDHDSHQPGNRSQARARQSHVYAAPRQRHSCGGSGRLSDEAHAGFRATAGTEHRVRSTCRSWSTA